MTNLEGLTLFTTGVRVAVLLTIITLLTRSLRGMPKASGAVTSPVDIRYLLGAVLTLLTFSMIELGLELVDHVGF